MVPDTVSAPDAGSKDVSAVDDAPMFSAVIEYNFQGYVVKGIFTEFLPDTVSAQPIYSLDGENWQTSVGEWDLRWLGTEEENAKKKLQNQICLYAGHEPLRSYLAGELDCFYLRLRLTRENGVTYETRTAVIERGAPQSLPEGLTPAAKFADSMFVLEKNPFNNYGRYQLTVKEDATPEDILEVLPETLPVEIQIQRGLEYVTKCIVDCPVTWKPLTLPRLIAGQSVTIQDAAEELVVPGGTLLNTPIGIFRLEDSLGINQYPYTDEVRLVLNVIARDENPTGVLKDADEGLEMAFDLKPTGATSIRAYTLLKDGTEWVELPESTLLEAVNAQPSAANSSYTLVLDNTSEPYQSYLALKETGDEPIPFYVGLRIEGGVYNGCQLVLAWPDTYEEQPNLPNMWGAGGNEGNAGANDKNDSTEEGCRPNLPVEPEEEAGVGKPEQSVEPEKESGAGKPEQSVEPEKESGAGKPKQSVEPEKELGGGNPVQPMEPEKEEGAGKPEQPMELEKEAGAGNPEQPVEPESKPIHENQQAKTSIGTEDKYSTIVPAANVNTDVPALEKADYRMERNSHGPLLPVAVAATVCICIIAIAGKVKKDQITHRITRGILKILHRL